MTRLEIKTAVRQSVRSYLATNNELDPWLLDNWVDDSVSDLCRSTDGWFISFTADIVADQGEYCLPELYFVDAAEAMLSEGWARPLGILTVDQLTGMFPWWRTQPDPAGDPLYMVTQGAGSVVLYPAPSYAASGGLTLRGFGPITNSVWPADSTECPLPGRTHAAIRDAVVVRYWEWVGDQPQRLSEARKRAFKSAGMFESEMATLTEAERSRRESQRRPVVTCWPLNM